MSFLIHLTIASSAVLTIVLSCILFTNAIEFLGNKLKLGNNATGSILAVIGTGLPEFIIPLVAIIGALFTNNEITTAQNVALGAIIGSPFMLSTLALFLLFIVAVIKKRKTINLDINFIIRDYKYFLIGYTIAILFTISFLNKFKLLAFAILLLLYIVFVYRTIVKSRSTCCECECSDLYFSKIKLNNNILLFIQLSISLILLILSSHIFVEEIKYFSIFLNISPAILALLITPFATELPECINSVIWLKQGKDDLAFANVIGAIVFQSTLLFSIGILLTPWTFEKPLVVNTILTVLCGICFLFSIIKNKKITLNSLILCGFVYFLYLILLIMK